jgi:hypothetical protein
MVMRNPRIDEALSREVEITREKDATKKKPKATEPERGDYRASREQREEDQTTR